ncbi:hypothetical protein D3C87_1591160 [compost metagenome]
MAGRHAVQQHDLAAQGDGHVGVEHPVRQGGRQPFADDRFDRALIGDDDGAIVLKHLGAADVVGVAVGIDDVFDRHVEAGADFVAQPGRGAGHRRINDQGALARDQDQPAVHGQPWPGRMTIEVTANLLQRARIVGTGTGRKVRQQRPVGVWGLIQRNPRVAGEGWSAP